MWRYLKAEVFKSCSYTILELKDAIVESVNEIPPQMVARTMSRFRDFLNECVAGGGGHFNEVIFKNLCFFIFSLYRSVRIVNFLLHLRALINFKCFFYYQKFQSL